jgi:hypothetical protein
MDQNMSVTTARAAQIVGIGYEGLRSQLKRGLLGNVGTLPPFYGPGAKVQVLYTKRWTWKKFSLADLCNMRIAKMLMDAGLSFDRANDIASNEEMHAYFGNYRYVQDKFLTVPLFGDNSYCIYPADSFLQMASDHVSWGHAVLLINLDGVRKYVLEAMQEDDTSMNTISAPDATTAFNK